jgi:chemotaxis signal transduction protein
MYSGCGIPIEMARGARDLLENENGEKRALVRTAGGIEWPRDEQSTTTPTVIGPKQWFCLFRGDAGPMAISVESVAEVLETNTLIRLAWSPPQVVGMCSYHREVIPVIKLGPLQGDGEEVIEHGILRKVAINSVQASDGFDEPSRCIVLILKTERGAWGIRVDSKNPIMSPESPEWDSPRVNSNGLVLIGSVRLAGICYDIVDAEATWRGVRSAVVRWSGQVGGSNASGPPPFREGPITAGAVATGIYREA